MGWKYGREGAANEKYSKISMSFQKEKYYRICFISMNEFIGVFLKKRSFSTWKYSTEIIK